MRFIDKSRILATEYKSWIDSLEERCENHDSYSHQHKYYLDVLVSLLHCQRGLCAYTEILISKPERYNSDNFNNKGRYIKGDKTSSGFVAQVDHFDSNIKKDFGWRWDNLFAVTDRINIEKGTKPTHLIMKPDVGGYDPFKVLDYSVERHLFFPSLKIRDARKEKKIKEMILCLGLNYGSIRDQREEYLTPKIKCLDYGFDHEPVYQFFTAYQFCKKEQNRQFI